MGELEEHAGGDCKCNIRNKGYSYVELTQQINSSKNWLHRMLGFYMHCLYDEYDEHNMKCIALGTVACGTKRKHELTNFEVTK